MRDGTQVGYSTFNKPIQFTGNNKTVNFTYGIDRSRIAKITRASNSTESEHIAYVGLGGEGGVLFEQETRIDSVVNKHYLYAGG